MHGCEIWHVSQKQKANNSFFPFSYRRQKKGLFEPDFKKKKACLSLTKKKKNQ
jgi:hypothetical protein